MGKRERLEALEERASRLDGALGRLLSEFRSIKSRTDNFWTTLNQVIGRLDTIDQQLKEAAADTGPEESPEDDFPCCTTRESRVPATGYLNKLVLNEESKRLYDKHWGPAPAPAPAPTMEPPGFRKLWPVAITNCRCDWYRQFDTTWKVDPDIGCLIHSP